MILLAMIPENPVVGGTVLRRAAIASPNFATGLTGWSINQDGSAEFNNVVIRGGQIVSGTALFYSTSPPAAGKLIASISAASGFDASGNQYIQGITTYLAGPPASAISLQGGRLELWTAATQAGPYTGQGQLFGDNAGNTDIQAGSGGSLFLNSHTVVTGGLAADTEAISSAQAAGLVLQVTNTTAAPSAPSAQMVAAAAADRVLGIEVTGDSNNRFVVDSNGQISWGGGGAVQDAHLLRSAAHVLQFTNADVDIATAGRGLQVAEGANAKMGTATLNGTTGVVVSTTAVTATSRIFLTTQAASGTLGCPVVASRVAGTSFTIKSTVAGDVSTVAWLLVEPG